MEISFYLQMGSMSESIRGRDVSHYQINVAIDGY